MFCVLLSAYQVVRAYVRVCVCSVAYPCHSSWLTVGVEARRPHIPYFNSLYNIVLGWAFFRAHCSLNRFLPWLLELSVIKNGLLLSWDLMSSIDEPILFEMPPKIKTFSYDSPSQTTAIQWLPMYASESLFTEYLTLSQTFWSSMKRTRSLRKGVRFWPLKESLRPPAIRIELLQGR